MNKHKLWLFMLLAATLVEYSWLAASNKSCSSSGFGSCSRSCDSSSSYDHGHNSSRSERSCDNVCGGSRTVFIPRSLTTDSTLELGLSNYQIYHPSCPIICPEMRPSFHFQAHYFHLESRNSGCLARYFLPHNKSCITLAENGKGDVGSLWLDLISAPNTSYQSQVSIHPHRRVDGGYFNFFFDLSRWSCGAWFSIAFAVARVEHKLCLKECPSDNPGTIEGVFNAVEALNNQAWSAGRFSVDSLCRTRVDDVQFKLGYNYYFCNRDHVGIYFVGTAPTGCRNRGLYVFEPIVGSKHGSVGVGLNTDWTLWQCGNKGLNWMADLKYRYVLRACERRSFDLCDNGDWSRYLQVVTPDQRSFSMPGINFFTQQVKVTPRSTIDFWTALHYDYCCYNFEIGYNLWWRECEQVHLRCPLACIGIYDMVGDCRRNPVSASNANITQSVVGPNIAPSDTSFTPVTEHGLNTQSGGHPTALTNKVYAAVSYNSYAWNTPWSLGVGGSYEFAHRNSALEQWGVWVKTNFSF